MKNLKALIIGSIAVMALAMSFAPIASAQTAAPVPVTGGNIDDFFVLQRLFGPTSRLFGGSPVLSIGNLFQWQQLFSAGAVTPIPAGGAGDPSGPGGGVGDPTTLPPGDGAGGPGGGAG